MLKFRFFNRDRRRDFRKRVFAVTPGIPNAWRWLLPGIIGVVLGGILLPNTPVKNLFPPGAVTILDNEVAWLIVLDLLVICCAPFFFLNLYKHRKTLQFRQLFGCDPEDEHALQIVYRKLTSLLEDPHKFYEVLDCAQTFLTVPKDRRKHTWWLKHVSFRDDLLELYYTESFGITTEWCAAGMQWALFQIAIKQQEDVTALAAAFAQHIRDAGKIAAVKSFYLLQGEFESRQETVQKAYEDARAAARESVESFCKGPLNTWSAVAPNTITLIQGVALTLLEAAVLKMILNENELSRIVINELAQNRTGKSQ